MRRYLNLIYSQTDIPGLLLHRLWHQLTLKLFEFYDYPPSKPYRVDTFERFVQDFESKMNQLRLVEMAVKVSKEIDSMCLSFPSRHIVKFES